MVKTFYVRFADNYTGASYKVFSRVRTGQARGIYGTYSTIVGRDIQQPVPLKNIVLPIMVDVDATYDDVYSAAVDAFTLRYGFDPSFTSCSCCAPADYGISIHKTLIGAVEDSIDDNDDNEYSVV